MNYLFIRAGEKVTGRTKVLIEKQNRSMWRVVVRACTERGLSSDRFNVVGDNYHRLPDAREVFDQVVAKRVKELKRPMQTPIQATYPEPGGRR